MTAHPGHDGEDGFLLAEMLTALTISAFVLGGLVALGAVLLRATDLGVAAVGQTDDLGRTLLSLDDLIRAAIRVRLDGAGGQPFLFNGDDRRLMIAHRETMPGAAPVTRVVALRSDAGRLLRAEAVLPARVAALGDLQFGPPRVVYAGGATLRFAYAAAAAPFGHEGRMAGRWPVGGTMPSAVAVEAVDEATGHILARTRVSLAANADLGCLVDGACGRVDTPGTQAEPPRMANAIPPATDADMQP